MNGERLRGALGWGSVGSGLVLLAFADPLRRFLKLPVRSASVRAVGVRDIVIGLGLVMRRDSRAWSWARTVSDAFDTAWLLETVGEHPPGASRRAALAAGGVALTLLDLVEVTRARRQARS